MALASLTFTFYLPAAQPTILRSAGRISHHVRDRGGRVSSLAIKLDLRGAKEKGEGTNDSIVLKLEIFSLE